MKGQNHFRSAAPFRAYGYWVFILLLLTGCNQFEFSPNQVRDRNSPTQLNEKNLAQLYQNPVDDTVTIVFVGDSQRWYDELDRFVDKVNTLNAVDFVLLAGDISDFGLLQEFEWVNDRLRRLEEPYIGVIGNHDLVANGEQVFTRMFGPTDFSFVYDSIKFVAHNTNSMEYSRRKVPDMPWLSNALSDSNDAAYIVLAMIYSDNGYGPVCHMDMFQNKWEENFICFQLCCSTHH
ncbi:metallophosphoesterase family protein [Dyadobacter alkalitolerans]|uniref:metallophosphoesterase family protein n=1 Tax=Dyadobacter alkalitolerans TaxID=492736 RepID=UPI0009FF48D0|nr:metallophosphoesterase [Dyadobacter alkalitolerans]